MIDLFFYISLGIAVAAWGVGYGLLQLWLWMIVPVIVGLVWLFGWFRDRATLRNHSSGRNIRSVASLGLVLFVFGNSLGVLYGSPAVLNLVSLLAALIAWDLDYFSQRLGKDQTSPANRELEQNHLLRLLMVCVATLLIGGLALLIHFKLGLGLAILFALLAAVGLNRMIHHLRKETD
jgi:hypothetical protein